MPSRHSKNSGDKHHLTYHEKQRAGIGSIKQRLGSESQLPFGYCALSMYPAEDPVVSPSGHLYSRESILEYILNKTKELKQQARLFEEHQLRQQEEELKRLKKMQEEDQQHFAEVTDGVVFNVKRKLEGVEDSEYFKSRKKLIDDTDRDVRIEELKKVSPWIPQFTPEAKEAEVKEPPKRPPSPFTGRPLRTKDLIPVNLIRESHDSSSDSDRVRYICPVSRKTITNQKVVLIKSTGALMLEQTAKDLAYPTKTCPLTGKKFDMADVLELVQATSGFSSTGQVEAKVHRPSIN